MLSLAGEMTRVAEQTQSTSTTDETPERAAEGPIGSAQALLELQATAGNRAVTQLIAARRAALGVARDPPTGTLDPPQEKKPVLTGHAGGPTSQKEFSFKRKIPPNKSISFKITFARTKDTKVLKGKAEKGRWDGSASVWEMKDVREKVGKDVAQKIQASLVQGEGTVDLIPGLIFKVNAKLLEYQLDRVTTESELNFLTVSGSFEGNITEWANLAAGVPEEDRSKVKITVAGEYKWTPRKGDLARLKEIWKQNDLIRREAKAVAENAKKLKAVEQQRKALEKQAKEARKHADELRRKLNKAKRKNLKKRYQQQLKRAEKKLADLAEKQGRLKRTGQELAEKIVKSEKAMREAGEAAAKAGAEMKGRLGKAIGKAIAKKTGKVVARFLLKAIPIINVLSTIYDLYELGRELDKFLRGGKWDPFGGGEDSGGENVEGGVEGGKGTEPPVDGGSGAEGGTSPDAGTGEDGGGTTEGGAPDGGTTEGGAPDGGTGEGGTGKVPAPDAGDGQPDAGPADGGTGAIEGVPDAGADTSTTTPPAEPPVTLHEQARSVYEIVKGQDVKLDPEHARQLDSIVPKELTPAQLTELAKRIEQIKGEGIEDPYEIIGRLHEEIERVVNGEPAVETTIDGERREDLSTPATPPVVPAEPAETSPDGGAIPKDKGQKPKTKQKPAKTKKKSAAEPVPKSLMPSIGPGFFTWNDDLKEWVMSDEQREELLGTNFNIGGGLLVMVTDVHITHQKTAEFTLGSVTYDLMVFDIPEKPGKSYPWKIGDTESFTERVAMDLKSGNISEISEEAGGQQAFEDALSFAGGTFSLKRKGTTVKWPGATLRIDDLADTGTLIGSPKDNDIYAVRLLVTPTSVTDASAGVVTTDGPVRFKEGQQVTIRLEVSIAKQPAAAP